MIDIIGFLILFIILFLMMLDIFCSSINDSLIGPLLLSLYSGLKTIILKIY